MTGCGPKAPRPEADQVLLFVPAAGEEVKVWQEAITAYETASKQRVYLHCEPPDQYPERLQAMIARGKAPDVAYVDSTRFPELVTSRALESLDSRLADSPIKPDDYFPATWDAFNYQGGQYAIPNAIATLAIARNVGKFEVQFLRRPPPDWTWQDYLEAARKLTVDSNNDGRIDTYGAVMSPWWQVYVWQNGGDLVDNPTRPTRSTLSTPEAQEALQFWADLTLKEKVAPPAALVKDAGRTAMFAGGRAAMIYCARHEANHFSRVRDFMWDFIDLPRGKQAANIGLCTGFVLCQGARNPDAAWQLITHLTSEEGQISLAAGSYYTPAHEAIANSEYNVSRLGPQDPFVAGIKVARPLPLTPRYAELARIYDEELEKLWSGQADVAEVTRRIDERVDRLLQETPSPTAWLAPLRFAAGRG
jgi:multiple sugar transport system substrate-binding protein